MELADTQDLGSCAKSMQVRPLSPAPNKHIDFDTMGIGVDVFFFVANIYV